MSLSIPFGWLLNKKAARIEVNMSLAFLYWVGITLHPWHFVSDIAIFVLKRGVKLQLTNCSFSNTLKLNGHTTRLKLGVFMAVCDIHYTILNNCLLGYITHRLRLVLLRMIEFALTCNSFLWSWLLQLCKSYSKVINVSRPKVDKILSHSHSNTNTPNSGIGLESIMLFLLSVTNNINWTEIKQLVS